MTLPSVAVVSGNPRPASRTLTAGLHLASRLTGRDADLVVDLADLGARLLDGSDQEVGDLARRVGAADLVVVACPTYKASYPGLLKVFLDRFDAGTGLRGVAAPLMLGAGPAHALAPELLLRPLLTELGATTLTGLYVLDSAYDDPTTYDAWLATARPIVAALTAVRTGAVA